MISLKWVESAAILAPFLILVFIASRIMARFNTRRYDRAFAPLMGEIDGTLMSDANSSMMSGKHGGRDVLAALSRGTRSSEFQGHSNTRRNILQIEMSQVAGVHDWKISYRSVYGIDRPDWHTDTANDALKASLVDSGAVAAINGMGTATFVRYSANRKTLTYSEDIRPLSAPPVQRFQLQLDLLGNLAAINERVNVA